MTRLASPTQHLGTEAAIHAFSDFMKDATGFSGRLAPDIKAYQIPLMGKATGQMVQPMRGQAVGISAPANG